MSILINSFCSSMWIASTFQTICLAVDSVIYGIAGATYNLFNEIVHLSAFSEPGNTANSLFNSIPGIMERIQTVVAVFMLFRLAIVLLQYVAEPEKLKDSKSGASKMLMNVVISLVMLVSSAYVFEIFARFQSATVGTDDGAGSNVIANLILGDEGKVMTGEAAGRVFANQVFLTFVNYNEADSWLNTGGIKGAIASAINWFDVGDSNLTFQDCYENIARGGSINSLMLFVGSPEIHYWPIISGLAGFFLIFYFFSFAIEMVVRLLKLKILEAISPIPILMYMDPGGQQYFKNFTKTYIGAYLDLYFKLASVYFAVCLAKGVLGWSVTNDTGFWLKLVLVMGIFYFTKELPKLLKQLFNLDMGEGGIKGKGFLKGLVGAGLGAAVGGIAGGIVGKRRGLSTGDALAAAGAGMARGGFTGARSKNVGDFVKGQVSSVGKNNALVDKVNGMGGVGQYAQHGLDNLTQANANSKKDIDNVNKYKQSVGAADSAVKSLVEGHKVNGVKMGDMQSWQGRDSRVKAAEDNLRAFNENKGSRLKELSSVHGPLSTNQSRELSELKGKSSIYNNEVEQARKTSADNYNNIKDSLVYDAIAGSKSKNYVDMNDAERAIRDADDFASSREMRETVERTARDLGTSSATIAPRRISESSSLDEAKQIIENKGVTENDPGQATRLETAVNSTKVARRNRNIGG
ncbi:MAG: hypothetical protein RR228_01640 [Bacilli bacterium]